MAKMGGARVFFTVLADAQVDNLIADSRAASTIMESVYLDSIESIVEGLDEMFNSWTTFSDAMVESAMDVEYAKIHFRKFFDEGIEASKEFEAQLASTGFAFGAAMQDSIEAGASMMQLEPVLGGVGAGVSATQASMLLGTVGMMEQETAMKTLMQLQMQTNFMYEGASDLAQTAGNEELKRQVVLGNSVKFVNMLNEAENKTGATIQNITQSMSQYAASAKLANMEMSEQVALSASLIEQGEEQGKSGRAIKMMLARLAADRSENNALLEKHGVLVTDEQGNMRGLMDIMGQLKTQTDEYGRSWDNLTTLERQNIAIAVAGSHHYVRFLKLMENYNRTAQIQEIVMDASGSAMEEFGNFTANAAFNLDRYNVMLEGQAAIMGELLIPAKLEAAKAELALFQARNKVLGTYVGGRFAQAMEMMNVGFGQASKIMEVIFALRVLRVAMQTHMLVQTQMAQRSTVTTKAVQNEIKANIMNGAARAKVAQMYMQGAKVQEIATQTGRSELQIEHAINEAIVLRMKNEMRMHSQGMEYAKVNLGGLHHLRKAEAERAQQTFILSDIEKQGYNIRIKQLNTEYRAKQQALLQEQGKIKFNGIATDQDKQLLNMRIARMRAEQAANRAEIANMLGKMELSEAMLGVDLATLSAKEKVILTENIENSLLATQGKIQGALNDAKAVAIRLDQTKTATQHVEAQMTLHGAKADMMATKAQTGLNMANKQSMLGMGPFSQAMMLASFAVNFFGDSSTAAEASMYLMMAAMVPLTWSMMSFAGATGIAAVNMAIITGGIAVAAGLAAYAMAGLTEEESEVEKQMREMEEAMADSERQMEALNEEMAKFESDATAGIMAVDEAMSDSVDSMKESLEEFDNKRMEVFFGGRTGRMSSALFKELKQVGVEQLYYQPEVNVNMNNTFNGLTYERATNQIADMVYERIMGMDKATMQGTGN